jgi:hypothetical protein
MRSKAEVERHHDMARAGNLALIVAAAFWS